MTTLPIACEAVEPSIVQPPRRSAYDKARKEAKTAAGLCRSCSQLRDGPQLNCSSCREKRRIKTVEKNAGVQKGVYVRDRPPEERTTRLRRLAAKQCIRCATDITGSTRTRCQPCIDTMNARSVGYSKKKREAGLCADCKEKPPVGKLRCKECAAKQRAATNRSMIKRLMSGLCTQCGAEPLPHAEAAYPVCEVCYLKAKAREYLGNRNRWSDLQAVFLRQNKQCAYTGEPIFLGVNDSIDHIYPQSLWPDLKNELSNLQFTTRLVNVLKSDMTPDEFVTVVRAVHNHTLEVVIGLDLEFLPASKARNHRFRHTLVEAALPSS